MKRGTLTILIILVIAVTAGVVSVWYHYRNQYRAQQFWGTATAVLIDRGPKVEVLRLGEPDRTISLDDDAADEPPPDETPADADAPPAPKAVEFNQTPWIVLETKDAAQAKGLANLRRALVLDSTFDWSAPPADKEPDWQYGLSVNDGRNWATVLFDFDSRQVGLTGGRKTVLLAAEASRDFRDFFAEQFSEKAEAGEGKEKKGDQPADGQQAEQE